MCVYSWSVGLLLWLLLTLFSVCWLLDFASDCCCDGFADCVLLLLIWLVVVWFGWLGGLVVACVVVVVVCCWCDCLRCICFRPCWIWMLLFVWIIVNSVG